jgi:dihydroorotase
VPKSYLIKNATLIETGHPQHLNEVDILITDGKIAGIEKSITTKASEIRGEKLYVSNGWVDMRCHLTDPGNEHKDTIQNLLDSAAAGGFTKIVTLPHSLPAIADKSSIQYINQAASYHLVDVKPTGVLSAVENQDNLAELYDMYAAGAIAFTNGDAKVSNGLLKKALLYAKPFGGRIITHPSDKSLEQHGMVNESETTIHTGLKTSPSLAEYISVKEQLEVAKYCDAPLHFSAISCKESVALIKHAKKERLPVTCDVAIANLCFTDQEVLHFDENFKLYPPLRTEEDRKALVKGVADGTIDAICSNHCPQNIENKEVEFDYADYGALSIQLVYAWYNQFLSKELELDQFINAITKGANHSISENSTTIAIGAEANLTVFDANASWRFDTSTNKSVSKNSHAWNQEQIGKVVAVFNNKVVNINL